MDTSSRFWTSQKYSLISLRFVTIPIRTTLKVNKLILSLDCINFNPDGLSFAEDIDFEKEMNNIQVEGFGKKKELSVESEGTETNDGDSGVFQFKKSTKVLKNDMNKIAQNLEKIRDMFINNGDNGKIEIRGNRQGEEGLGNGHKFLLVIPCLKYSDFCDSNLVILSD